MSVTAFAFSDTRGHWAEETIQAMTEKGYLSGYPDGTFGPNNTIRRAAVSYTHLDVYKRQPWAMRRARWTSGNGPVCC